MKVLVAYMSKTGNTKKVAEAIFGEITDDKEIKPINEVDSIEKYDLAFLGFPVIKEGLDGKAATFLKKQCINGRNVVLFVTHAAPEDHPDLPPMLEKFRQAADGAYLVDMFDCQGELAKNVKMIMSILPNAKYRMWAKQDNSQGQPDKARLDRARTFSRDVMQRFQDIKCVDKSESRRQTLITTPI